MIQCNLYFVFYFIIVFYLLLIRILGSGGSLKDIEKSRNGVSKHRKATRRIIKEDEEDEDTMEASRPLMKKKKRVNYP